MSGASVACMDMEGEKIRGNCHLIAMRCLPVLCPSLDRALPVCEDKESVSGCACGLPHRLSFSCLRYGGVGVSLADRSTEKADF